jgi:hypothetical protein
MGAGMAPIRIFFVSLVAAMAVSAALTASAGAAVGIGPAISLGGGKPTPKTTAVAAPTASAPKEAAGSKGSGSKKTTVPVSSQPAPTPPPPAEAGPQPAAGPLYWGATIGSQLTGNQAPWDMSAVTKFEEMTQKKLSLVQFFQPFANCGGGNCSFYAFPTTPLENIRQHGAIPVLSWSSQSIPASVNEPEFQLSDLISGRYDSYIREFATKAKAWGHPFFLRFNWEMNGNWFPWSGGVNGNAPGEFATAWRHVHDIFATVGATNVSWVWCPNVELSANVGSLASLYPGDAYVDWTGMDGYNWGTNPVKPGGWKTFSQIFSATYRYIQGSVAPSKPMMVGEVASTEFGGSKAAWIQEMIGDLPGEFPGIRALLWFDKYDDGMDWPLETSSAATSAFAQGIQNPTFVGNLFSSLGALSIQPFS